MIEIEATARQAASKAASVQSERSLPCPSRSHRCAKYAPATIQASVPFAFAHAEGGALRGGDSDAKVGATETAGEEVPASGAGAGSGASGDIGTPYGFVEVLPDGKGPVWLVCGTLVTVVGGPADMPCSMTGKRKAIERT